MDISLLSKMVRDLILDHDEVALPGVGTFVAEVVPASFSDKGYTINPPYRRLSFRTTLGSDTLLTDLYAESNNVDKDVARAIISQYVSNIKEVLKERKTIVFPGLGRLRATRQNNFFFVSDEDIDIFPDGFGLQAVSLKTHIETDDEIDAALSSLESLVNFKNAAAEQPVAEPVAEPAEPEEQPVAEPVEMAVEPVVEPAALAVPEPEPAPVEPESVPATLKKRHSKWWWAAPLAIVAVCAVALATFLILAQVCPDFIDSILYTPEELRIINY